MNKKIVLVLFFFLVNVSFCIFSAKTDYSKGYHGYTKKFKNQNLSQANLSAASFQGSDFSSEPEKTTASKSIVTFNNQTNLSKVNATYSNFKEVDFLGSNLSAGNFSGSSFVQADFSGANLKNANMSYSDCSSANFSALLEKASQQYFSQENGLSIPETGYFLQKTEGADCTNVDFSYANLKNTNFNGAILVDAKCIGVDAHNATFISQTSSEKYPNVAPETAKAADCSGAVFSYANLKQVDFTEAQLEKVNFEGSDCSGAVFKNTNCSNVNFSYTNLSGANFTGAKLSGAKFLGALLDKTTIMPNGKSYSGSISDLFNLQG